MSGTITRIGATGAGALLALGIFAAPPAGATGSGGHGGGHQSAACFTATGHTQGRSHSDPDGMSNGGADKPGCTGGFDADRDGNNGCGNDADREDDNNGNCGRAKAQQAGDQSAAQVEAEKQDHRGDAAGRAHDGRCHASSSSSTSSTTTTTTGSPATVGAAGASSGKCSCPLGSEAAFAAPPKVSVGPAAVGTTVKLTGTDVAGATVSGAALTAAAAGPASPDIAATTAGTGATPGTEVAAAGATTTTTAPGTQVLGESISRPSALARTGAGVGVMALLGIVLCGSGRLAVLARRLLRIG